MSHSLLLDMYKEEVKALQRHESVHASMGFGIMISIEGKVPEGITNLPILNKTRECFEKELLYPDMIKVLAKEMRTKEDFLFVFSLGYSLYKLEKISNLELEFLVKER